MRHRAVGGYRCTARVGHMSRSEQCVQIFALGLPEKGTPREKRRYLVRWRVEGRDRMRSKKTKAEAERLRARLQNAVINGEEFDPTSGLPLSWVQEVEEATWWTWSREWLELKWPQWSGNSRRSAVESLVAFTPHLARRGAPPMPPEDIGWLREHGYRPDSPKGADHPEWLDRWSLPLHEMIDPAPVERALTAATTKLDGTPVARDVARRRRGTLAAVCKAAVRRNKMEHNPLTVAEWSSPAPNVAVDISVVPSPTEMVEIVDHVATLNTAGARYSAFYACVGIAGMRPSEASGLWLSDLDLPKEGWGLAILRGATTRPGARYTADGTNVEDKELKHRPEDAVREVPLSPELVSRLRWHLKRWPSVDQRVFTNADGLPVTSSNYGRVWLRTRGKVWPSGHRLAATAVYDLRHAAATMMLRAGVPPAEVARRLGHSVDMLMRVYAGVFDDERERSNAILDHVLKGNPEPWPRSA